MKFENIGPLSDAGLAHLKTWSPSIGGTEIILVPTESLIKRDVQIVNLDRVTKPKWRPKADHPWRRRK